MPLDYTPLDPTNFSKYCTKKNALLTYKELKDMLSLRFCKHLISHGEHKGKFCMVTSKDCTGYCSRHKEKNMSLYRCNSISKRGLCKQKVKKKVTSAFIIMKIKK
jgi:hypothetical protein